MTRSGCTSFIMARAFGPERARFQRVMMFRLMLFRESLRWKPVISMYGVVADNHGRPLQGVVVSDGYSCTATDENGVYQLTGCEHSYQIYVSVPAEYEIPLGEGLPRFWQQIAAGRKRYDFTLTPLAGGKESAFNLFCVADPQCQNNSHIARFENETVPDIAGQAALW